MRSPPYSDSTSVLELIPIAQVLGGRIETLNVAEDVHFEPNSGADEGLKNQIFLALHVRGEEGELIDATGLAWGVPSLIHDTPERSEVWAKHCVEVMKSIIAGSKPRQAIRDATIFMETAILMRGEVELCSVDALCGRG